MAPVQYTHIDAYIIHTCIHTTFGLMVITNKPLALGITNFVRRHITNISTYMYEIFDV